ncbi:MAG: hypothetical protein UX38_C0003G0004 [Microgenomates group bacterium GW2011_GWC1_46_16]|uniref:mRNA interferase n=2 Tax=Candidatus Collieribacteriota TaxID=1752725 RepID=A0A1F5FYL8_9BACT|nr:MAG: hypothetical protein UX32_C0002G0010 [Microgenomates group bacterium GW2011_GWF1_46_12]KKU26739.1 MAG: hypothetical protein UX38_C0003G0004 [Microgenomates group bacterium GW2011_GWC1_46_16]KKU27974.1 MAG: hypothetical protein UX40_C0004G0004 [Microgenomates group bacterium GW2011_GWF2_46_18]KKU43259.1 MAG: hypothetical protein UX59_C0024G0015 [Microgenomates group bacterium GW2011_GWA1_46_7]KKU45648.1 MAG: hypothetical protein UX63_C0002G0009 [Microgenomates group bacterium GW2011_GWB1
MYKTGSVILIKMHPASGQELKKFRPALVLQFHPLRNFVTFIPLTSQTKTISLNEAILAPSSTNGLEKPSLALCWYIQTVGTNRIQKKLGQLNKIELNKVITLVKKSLFL